MFEAYCQRIGCDKNAIRFSFDGNRISSDDTAEKIGMEDGDVIDAMIEQTGGF